MRHAILVKWAEPVPPALVSRIAALFHQTFSLPWGEKSVQLFPAQLAGDKRYDLLIEMKLKGTAAMEATLRPPFGSQRNL